VDGASRMGALINDLLAYSRLGAKGPELAPTSCEEALKRALANLQASIADSHAEVTHTALPLVTGDQSQLTQLFQNLIGNALKFRASRPPRVQVWAEQQDGHWAFGVSDNGIGIEPQYAEKIFTVFQRLHTREEYPGTGIGLALCKKIVERHGGKIWVESQPGQGSTFRFTLPAEALADTKAEAASSEGPKLGIRQAGIGKEETLEKSRAAAFGTRSS